MTKPSNGQSAIPGFSEVDKADGGAGVLLSWPKSLQKLI